MKTETVFWDTSAIIPLCVFQETTSAARKVGRRFASNVVWWGTVVEIHSTFVRLKQTGQLEDRGFDYAMRKWLDFRKRGRDIKPSESILGIAVELPSKYPLRALDAFQLAAALVWCGERPRNRPFICADLRLGEAARDAGFDVIAFRN